MNLHLRVHALWGIRVVLLNVAGLIGILRRSNPTSEQVTLVTDACDWLAILSQLNADPLIQSPAGLTGPFPDREAVDREAGHLEKIQLDQEERAVEARAQRESA